MRTPITLVLLIALAAVSGVSSADVGQQRALVGQWIAADPNDTSALVFLGDGSWALATNGTVVAGGYIWNGEDSLELDFTREGKPMFMTWQLQVAGDALQVVEAPGKIVKWLRVATSRTNETLAIAPVATATVRFDGAVIGLTKSDGSSWDLDGVVSEDDLARFKSAAWKAAAKGVAATDSVTAAAGVVAAIGSATITHIAKPDPLGTVELLVDGQVVGGQRGRIDLPRILNTFTPSWQLGPWTHVPFDEKHDVRLRLYLEDHDPQLIGGNDRIGVVEVNREDLLRAARLGKVLPIYVGDQSENQIMFVKISVTVERGAQLLR